MNHTPGPWTHNFGQDGWLIEAADEEQTYRVACVFEDIGAYRIPDADNRDDEGEANARLIAVAPEQNAALIVALEWWHSDYRHMQQKEPAWVPLARAAIAKARG